MSQVHLHAFDGFNIVRSTRSGRQTLPPSTSALSSLPMPDRLLDTEMVRHLRITNRRLPSAGTMESAEPGPAPCGSQPCGKKAVVFNTKDGKFLAISSLLPPIDRLRFVRHVKVSTPECEEESKVRVTSPPYH